jgi:exosome complex component MTR3
VEGALLLDPTADEVAREEAGLALALLPTTNEVSQLVSRGRWGERELRDALELAMGGCAQLEAAARQCLRDAAAAAAAKQAQQAEAAAAAGVGA